MNNNSIVCGLKSIEFLAFPFCGFLYWSNNSHCNNMPSKLTYHVIAIHSHCICYSDIDLLPHNFWTLVLKSYSLCKPYLEIYSAPDVYFSGNQWLWVKDVVLRVLYVFTYNLKKNTYRLVCHVTPAFIRIIALSL